MPQADLSDGNGRGELHVRVEDEGCPVGALEALSPSALLMLLGTRRSLVNRTTDHFSSPRSVRGFCRKQGKRADINEV